MVTSRALAAFAALLGVGCVGAPDLERGSSAVQGGTGSPVNAVVMAAHNAGACGAVAVGIRHVLTLDICTGATGMQVAVGASLSEPDLVADVSDTLTGPVLISTPSEVRAVLLVTAQDLPVTPADLAADDPSVDDVLTGIGYGNSAGSGTTRTEGAVRVASVDGALFVAAGEGGIELCPGDAGAFDGDGAYAGMMIHGEPGTGACLDPMTYAAVSSFLAFVEENVPAVEPPDAGAGTDAGASGPDAGEAEEDSGGCRLGTGDRPLGAAWLVLFAAFLVARLRPTRRRSR